MGVGLLTGAESFGAESSINGASFSATVFAVKGGKDGKLAFVPDHAVLGVLVAVTAEDDVGGAGTAFTSAEFHELLRWPAADAGVDEMKQIAALEMGGLGSHAGEPVRIKLRNSFRIGAR